MTRDRLVHRSYLAFGLPTSLKEMVSGPGCVIEGLAGPPRSLFTHDSEIIKGNLPVLTSFVLQPLLSDCRRSQANRNRFNAFEDAPELCTTHLNGHYLNDTIIPRGELLQLTTRHVYLDEWFYALLRVPQITYVSYLTTPGASLSSPQSSSHTWKQYSMY